MASDTRVFEATLKQARMSSDARRLEDAERPKETKNKNLTGEDTEAVALNSGKLTQ